MRSSELVYQLVDMKGTLFMPLMREFECPIDPVASTITTYIGQIEYFVAWCRIQGQLTHLEFRVREIIGVWK